MKYFYFGIKTTLKKRDKEMRNALSSNVLNNSQSRSSESSVKIGHTCDNTRHRDASKVLFNLSMIYAICVWPGRLVLTLVTFVSIDHFGFIMENLIIFIVIIDSLEVWIFVNSIANVFVYAFLDKDFRYFVLTVLTLGCLKKKIP